MFGYYNMLYPPRKTLKHKNTSVMFGILKKHISKLCEFHMLYTHCKICYCLYSVLSIVECRIFILFFNCNNKITIFLGIQKMKRIVVKGQKKIIDLCITIIWKINWKYCLPLSCWYSSVPNLELYYWPNFIR